MASDAYNALPNVSGRASELYNKLPNRPTIQNVKDLTSTMAAGTSKMASDAYNAAAGAYNALSAVSGRVQDGTSTMAAGASKMALDGWNALPAVFNSRTDSEVSNSSAEGSSSNNFAYWKHNVKNFFTHLREMVPTGRNSDQQNWLPHVSIPAPDFRSLGNQLGSGINRLFFSSSSPKRSTFDSFSNNSDPSNIVVEQNNSNIFVQVNPMLNQPNTSPSRQNGSTVTQPPPVPSNPPPVPNNPPPPLSSIENNQENQSTPVASSDEEEGSVNNEEENSQQQATGFRAEDIRDSSTIDRGQEIELDSYI